MRAGGVRLGCVLALWLGSHGAGTSVADRVIFVDDSAPAGGNGASWATAFRSLQDALFDVQRAPRASEIRIGQGMFKPDFGHREDTGDRDASFRLLDDLALRGGFAGFGAADPDERDIERYVTVLSGDLAGDDGPDFTNINDNSRHVVSGEYASTAVLDGFTITAGNADLPYDVGGGLEGGSASVTRCVFEGNRAVFLGGAAACFARFSQCTFRGNRSESTAGAVFAEGGATIDCVFIDNRAVLGGAGAGQGLSSHAWEGCVFERNTAEQGGALWFGDYGGCVTIDGCEFRDNHASTNGGAVFFGDEYCPTVTNSIFDQNSAAGAGGGVYSSSKIGAFTDVVFRQNGATLGGGLFRRDGEAGDRSTLIGCTFETNAAVLGGGAYVESADVAFIDCALLGNTAIAGGGIYNDAGRLAITDGSVDANVAVLDGGGVFCLGDVATDGASFLRNSASDGGGLHVVSGTASVNASLFDGNTAARGAGIYGLRSTLTMNDTDVLRQVADGDGGGVYVRESTADLADCTLSANAGDEGGAVDVVDGSLVMTRCRVSENAAYVGAGVAGFDSDLVLTDCLVETNHAGASYAGLWSHDGSRTVVERCLFRKNTCNGLGAGIGDQHNASLRVVDCSFIDNAAFADGAGMHTQNGLIVEVVGCTFTGNTALADGSDGGGLHIIVYLMESERLLVTDCVFEDNVAPGVGGGLAVRGNDVQVRSSQFRRNRAMNGGALGGRTGSLEVVDCSFIDNTATRDGGALSAIDDLTLINCLFASNEAERAAGAMVYNDGLTPSHLVVTNCTFANNETNEGGAVTLRGADSARFDNCIIRANATGQIIEVESTAIVTYSNVEGSFPGVGNIDANPLFFDAPAGDYRLVGGSPCIDAADSDAVPAGVYLDLGGGPRFVDDPETKDTGAGTLPIVDMGAYEFQARMCDADVTGDGVVGFADVLTLLALWGPCQGCPEDVDGSGEVGFGDVLIVLAGWGPC